MKKSERIDMVDKWLGHATHLEPNEKPRTAHALFEEITLLRSRISELESALRKVDEIRHELKRATGKAVSVVGLVNDLKAPCMVVYK